jgi:hypothetical protein
MSTINCMTNRKPMLHSDITKYINIIRDVRGISQASCRRIIFEKIIETGNGQDNRVHFSLLRATMLTFKRLLLILSDETKSDFVDARSKYFLKNTDVKSSSL